MFKSIKAAVRSLKNPVHGATVANYYIVQLNSGFDVRTKKLLLTTDVIVLDCATL